MEFWKSVWLGDFNLNTMISWVPIDTTIGTTGRVRQDILAAQPRADLRGNAGQLLQPMDFEQTTTRLIGNIVQQSGAGDAIRWKPLEI